MTRELEKNTKFGKFLQDLENKIDDTEIELVKSA